MFFGTIHDDVRRYIADCRDGIKNRPVVVGCSGNFTSEKILSEYCQPAAIHSNDVSLYSRLLADAMLNTVTPLSIEDKDYLWLEDYFAHKNLYYRPAAIMILLRMLKYEKQNSIHAKRMWRNYQATYTSLIEETVTKLRAAACPITSFASADVFDHFRNFTSGDEIFTAYLPFFKGDYESQYRRLTKIISWPAPVYPLLDSNRKTEIINWLLDKPHLFLLDYPLEDREPQMISHKGRNTWVYLYSNIANRSALFRRNYGHRDTRFELLQSNVEFTSDTKIGISRISTSDILYYKGLFLARNIDYTGGEIGFAVLVNDKVAGFIEMSRGKYGGGEWYMLSDFPVEPKPHPKFSKLIVLIALSNEVRKILEHSSLEYSTCVVTTARTEKPVSMKYRGPMKLIKRGRDENGKQYLNYSSPWHNKTIAEQYAIWLKQNQSQNQSSKSASNSSR